MLASGVPFAAGLLAVRHDPGNWVGTWLTAAGANILLQMAHGNWADALAAPPSDLAASAELLNLTQGIWMGWFLPFAMVLLLFPDGRPNDAWARRTAVALLLSVVAFNLFLAVAPGPLMPPLDDWPRPFGEHWVGYGAIPALVVFYACLVLAALATRRRYRAAADELERARLRWMFVACLTVPATILLCWAGYLLTGTPIVALGGLVAMNIAIPAATLVAMLRHDLYDVDRAVVAAAVYPVLAFLVVAGHATVSSAVALAVGADSTAPAVLATVVVVVLLLPARAAAALPGGGGCTHGGPGASRPSRRWSPTSMTVPGNRKSSSPCCARPCTTRRCAWATGGRVRTTSWTWRGTAFLGRASRSASRATPSA